MTIPYLRGPTQVWNNYRKGADARHLSFSLTREEFDVLVTLDCAYCGAGPQNTVFRGKNCEFHYNGLDRINNQLGYHLDNVIPCCRTCNAAKGELSLEEFLTWIRTVNRTTEGATRDSLLTRREDMASQAKFPHIRIDEMIWDDPVIVGLKPSAFRTYVFAIAWSRSQHGRVPDGILTAHGCNRVGATPKDLQDLVDAKLFKDLGEGSYEILKYAQWQVTSEEEKATSDVRRESGKLGAAKRWQKSTDDHPVVIEEGFDQEAAFEVAWAEWPEAAEPKFREKRTEALDAFRANITSQKIFERFSAALTNRLKEFRRDARSRDEKRKFLGAFKNFCVEKWENWLPKNFDKDSIPEVQPPPPSDGTAAKPWTPEF